MIISPQTTDWPNLYKILTGSVVPRPIGWVSTVNEEGQNNLAPYSFFNAVCSNPPTLLFCPAVPPPNENRPHKDTLANIRATGEFVVNIVTESTADAMNTSATAFPPEVDEFQQAGLTPIASEIVRPMCVSESPIHFECKLNQIIEIGPRNPGAGNIVIGDIVMIHVADHLINDRFHIDMEALKPIGRLAGNAYCKVNHLFEIERR